ncbi:hypothetical protein Lser_V15G22177 [Lactuca serriola]
MDATQTPQLACHARISTPTSQLGLTKLQYGIIHGYGATI